MSTNIVRGTIVIGIAMLSACKGNGAEENHRRAPTAAPAPAPAEADSGAWATVVQSVHTAAETHTKRDPRDVAQLWLAALGARDTRRMVGLSSPTFVVSNSVNTSWVVDCTQLTAAGEIADCLVGEDVIVRALTPDRLRQGLMITAGEPTGASPGEVAIHVSIAGERHLHSIWISVSAGYVTGAHFGRQGVIPDGLTLSPGAERTLREMTNLSAESETRDSFRRVVPMEAP